MATQNIVQYLETSQYFADQRDGSTTSIGPEAMNRRQIETFIAGGVIAANDLVALDFSATGDGTIGITVVKADSGSTDSIAALGFALSSAAAAGETVDVTIAGIHVSANVNTVAKGDRLKISAVAGQADVYGNTDTVPVLAYALEADTANVASVFVIKQM
jgi:hypothetical protein